MDSNNQDFSKRVKSSLKILSPNAKLLNPKKKVKSEIDESIINKDNNFKVNSLLQQEQQQQYQKEQPKQKNKKNINKSSESHQRRKIYENLAYDLPIVIDDQEYLDRKETLRIFMKSPDLALTFGLRPGAKPTLIDRDISLGHMNNLHLKMKNDLLTKLKEKKGIMYVKELWSTKHYNKVIKKSKLQQNRENIVKLLYKTKEEKLKDIEILFNKRANNNAQGITRIYHDIQNELTNQIHNGHQHDHLYLHEHWHQNEHNDENQNGQSLPKSNEKYINTTACSYDNRSAIDLCYEGSLKISNSIKNFSIQNDCDSGFSLFSNSRPKTHDATNYTAQRSISTATTVCNQNLSNIKTIIHSPSNEYINIKDDISKTTMHDKDDTKINSYFKSPINNSNESVRLSTAESCRQIPTVLDKSCKTSQFTLENSKSQGFTNKKQYLVTTSGGSRYKKSGDGVKNHTLESLFVLNQTPKQSLNNFLSKTSCNKSAQNFQFPKNEENNSNDNKIQRDIFGHIIKQINSHDDTRTKTYQHQRLYMGTENSKFMQNDDNMNYIVNAYAKRPNLKQINDWKLTTKNLLINCLDMMAENKDLQKNIDDKLNGYEKEELLKQQNRKKAALKHNIAQYFYHKAKDMCQMLQFNDEDHRIQKGNKNHDALHYRYFLNDFCVRRAFLLFSSLQNDE